MSEHEPRELTAVLVEFSQILTGQHGVHDILRQLGDYCTELLPVHGIGVLISRDGGDGMTVATANSDAGDTVEHLEVELREGPCTDAVRRGEQVVVPDLEAAVERYPHFAPRALQAGVRSIHALPMTARGVVVGSMDIVALEPLRLSVEQVDSAQLLADVALAFLLNSHRLAEATRLAEQLQQALESRVVIEQAKGKLAERHGVSMDAAFERLRQHARTNGERVQRVARLVVDDELRV